MLFRSDGRAICRVVRTRGRIEPVFVERIEDLAESLRQVLRDGDVVLTMGAGNIGAVAAELKSCFAAGTTCAEPTCAGTTCAEPSA